MKRARSTLYELETGGFQFGAASTGENSRPDSEFTLVNERECSAGDLCKTRKEDKKTGEEKQSNQIEQILPQISTKFVKIKKKQTITQNSNRQKKL